MVSLWVMSAEILKALKAKGAKTYIPLWHGRSGRNSGAAVGMNYEPEQDRIRCPAGKYLYPSPANYENRRRFVSLPAACRGCSLASSCPAKARPRSPHTRFVLRPLDQDLFDEVQAQMNEPDFGQEGDRADVEVRGTVRRGEATPRLVARQVSRAVQSANPGLPVRDRAEPQAPALPTLLLAGR